MLSRTCLDIISFMFPFVFYFCFMKAWFMDIFQPNGCFHGYAAIFIYYDVLILATLYVKTKSYCYFFEVLYCIASHYLN